MSNLTFGLTLILVGMGGTLLTLAFFSVLMTLLKKLFPVPKETSEEQSMKAE